MTREVQKEIILYLINDMHHVTPKHLVQLCFRLDLYRVRWTGKTIYAKGSWQYDHSSKSIDNWFMQNFAQQLLGEHSIAEQNDKQIYVVNIPVTRRWREVTSAERLVASNVVLEYGNDPTRLLQDNLESVPIKALSCDPDNTKIDMFLEYKAQRHRLQQL